MAVTGGASGIGAACCRHLAARGANVAVLDIDEENAGKVAQEIGGTSFTLDVSSETSVQKAVSAVSTSMGRIDGAITSAGIIQSPLRPDELSMDTYDRIYAVNQRGTYLCLREFGAHMLGRGSGSLVAISSITASRGTPLHAYGPGKAAITNMVWGLAGEWGRGGIRVNAIEPGYTLTAALQEQIDKGQRDPSRLAEYSALGRMLETDEIASVAGFLLSGDASGVTGTSIPVDAGLLQTLSWAPYGGARPPRD